MHIQPLEPRRFFTVVDLLVVYDTSARTSLGGTGNITALIQQSIDAANAAFDNSAIPTTIRLVHSAEVTYTSSGDLATDASRMRNPSDGYVDSIHTLRNTYGADLAMLVTDVPGNFGGNAFLLDDVNSPDDTLAFSAIDASAIGPNNLTIAHELGHNLGFGHERNNPTQPAVGPFPYSLGYRFTGTDANTYHDIMSYAPGIEVAYFANPAVNFRGAATGSAIGNADEADLKSTAAVTTPIVAAYRGTVVADTISPSAGISQIIRNGDVLMITVTYKDDRDINLSSIDSDDLTVTTPEGFVLTAGLEGVKNPGVAGGVKQATYRAVVPENHPTTESLVFSLKPNAVGDLSGHFTPTGVLTQSAARVNSYGYAQSHDFSALQGSVSSGGVLKQNDNDHLYHFTLDTAATVNAKLTGLSADATLYLITDANGNGIFDDTATDGSFNSGTTDEALTVNLAAGEYFFWVHNVTAGVNTPYKISIRRFTDTAPPTAVLDATDIKTAGGNQFIFRVGFTDNEEVDATSARYYAPIRLQDQFGGWYAATSSSIDSDLDGKTRWVTYTINAGFTFSAAWNRTFTISLEPQNGVFNLPDYVGDTAGNHVVPVTLGTMRIAIGQSDAIAPTAAAKTTPVVVGGATAYDFTVDYQDNVALDIATIGNGDVRVTGPGGFDFAATLLSLSSAPSVGSLRTATYRITPPGGSWNPDDNGNYSVVMQSNQVRDTSSVYVVSGTLSTFNVHVMLSGDANADHKVTTVDFNILAGNFSKRGRGFYEGDWSYDGIVDSVDFALLAGNYGRQIPVAGEALFGETLSIEVERMI